MSNMDAQFSIEKAYGCFGSWDTNTKEFNLVSWNNRYPSYDIRTWYPDEMGNKKPGKGITLTNREVIKLYEMLRDNMEDFKAREAENERRRNEAREKRDREYQSRKGMSTDEMMMSGMKPMGRTKNGIPRDDSYMNKKRPSYQENGIPEFLADVHPFDSEE